MTLVAVRGDDAASSEHAFGIAARSETDKKLSAETENVTAFDSARSSTLAHYGRVKEQLRWLALRGGAFPCQGEK